MQLTYTGPETNALLLEVFPKTAPKTIALCKTQLQKLATYYNSSLEYAYNAVLVKGCKPQTALFLFAALWQLLNETEAQNKELLSQIKTLENEKRNIGNQLFILENSGDVGGKNDLRAVYIEQLNYKDHKINECINALEVAGVQYVRPTQNN